MESIIGDFKRARSMVDKPYSSLQRIRHIIHTPLPCSYLGNTDGAIKTTLEEELGIYDSELKGVPVAYNQKSAKFKEKFGNMISAQPYIHCKIQGDFIVFCPKLGDVLEGVVNKVTDTMIGCLIHGCFYATIHKDAGDDKTVEENDPVKLQVTKLEEDDNGVLSITGELYGTRKYTDLNLAAAKSKSTCADSGIEDSGASTKSHAEEALNGLLTRSADKITLDGNTATEVQEDLCSVNVPEDDLLGEDVSSHIKIKKKKAKKLKKHDIKDKKSKKKKENKTKTKKKHKRRSSEKGEAADVVKGNAEADKTFIADEPSEEGYSVSNKGLESWLLSSSQTDKPSDKEVDVISSKPEEFEKQTNTGIDDLNTVSKKKARKRKRDSKNDQHSLPNLNIEVIAKSHHQPVAKCLKMESSNTVISPALSGTSLQNNDVKEPFKPSHAVDETIAKVIRGEFTSDEDLVCKRELPAKIMDEPVVSESRASINTSPILQATKTRTISMKTVQSTFAGENGVTSHTSTLKQKKDEQVTKKSEPSTTAGQDDVASPKKKPKKRKSTAQKTEAIPTPPNQQNWSDLQRWALYQLAMGNVPMPQSPSNQSALTGNIPNNPMLMFPFMNMNASPGQANSFPHFPPQNASMDTSKNSKSKRDKSSTSKPTNSKSGVPKSKKSKKAAKS